MEEIIRTRHEGEQDVTVITQDAVLATFDRILGALTLGVAGIAAISLAVAGILVMNVMLVAVTQRTGEIGLLKALGATGGTIRMLFLAEASMLSLVGAVVGYVLGQARRRADPPRCIRCSRPIRPTGRWWRGWPPRSSPACCSACCRRGARRGSTRCRRWRGS